MAPSTPVGRTDVALRSPDTAEPSAAETDDTSEATALVILAGKPDEIRVGSAALTAERSELSALSMLETSVPRMLVIVGRRPLPTAVPFGRSALMAETSEESALARLETSVPRAPVASGKMLARADTSELNKLVTLEI